MAGPTAGDVGEEALLKALAPYLATAGGALLVGPGDDAAAWQPAEGEAVVVTTDTLVEDVHFTPPTDEADAADLGWKLLAVSLSDIAAMGADPGPAFISLAVPSDWEVAILLALYRGLAECGDRFGSPIAGGNVARSPVAVLTSTCLGSVEAGAQLQRGGVEAGWSLGITGRIGGAAAGLRTARDGSSNGVPAGPWRQRLRRPEPRLGPGRALVDGGIRVAIDVSDGVYLDAGRLLGGGATGLVIDVDELPVEAGVKEAWPDDWIELVGGGEDYELLFAGPDRLVLDACTWLERNNYVGKVIGRFDGGNAVRLLQAGDETAAPLTGYQHFGG